MYLEVKGTDPTEEEIRKADDVTDRTDTPVLLLVGRPDSGRNGLMNCGLLVKGSCGWHSDICPHDLDQLYLQGMGYLLWLKLPAYDKAQLANNRPRLQLLANGRGAQIDFQAWFAENGMAMHLARAESGLMRLGNRCGCEAHVPSWHITGRGLAARFEGVAGRHMVTHGLIPEPYLTPLRGDIAPEQQKAEEAEPC